MKRIPLFARKFVVDFAETALATAFALSIAAPQSVEDLRGAAVAIGVGIFGALIAAARRAVPGFIAWLTSILAVDEDDDQS